MMVRGKALLTALARAHRMVLAKGRATYYRSSPCALVYRCPVRLSRFGGAQGSSQLEQRSESSIVYFCCRIDGILSLLRAWENARGE